MLLRGAGGYDGGGAGGGCGIGIGYCPGVIGAETTISGSRRSVRNFSYTLLAIYATNQYVYAVAAPLADLLSDPPLVTLSFLNLASSDQVLARPRFVPLGFLRSINFLSLSDLGMIGF